MQQAFMEAQIAELTFVSVDEASGVSGRLAARRPKDPTQTKNYQTFHIGIYGKRERESGFFVLGVTQSIGFFNVYVLQCYIGAWAAPAPAQPPRAPLTAVTPIRIVLDTSMFSLIFIYVLCRVRVPFC